MKDHRNELQSTRTMTGERIATHSPLLFVLCVPCLCAAVAVSQRCKDCIIKENKRKMKVGK